jgi:5'-nucleotidase
MTLILVTNDDGYNAPGILALSQVMRTLGEVRVIAPATNQSASGHKRTFFQDLPTRPETLADGYPALAVHGSPADCVALGMLGLAGAPVDLVVSGVNRGSNMGQDITTSGTVTAAIEASIHNCPAIAISLDDHSADQAEDYEEAARLAAIVARTIIEKGLPTHTLLNLNVPSGGTVKGLRLTRQGIRVYQDELEQVEQTYRVVGPPPGGMTDEEGTDLWAVHRGYASLTPLHLDLTAHRYLADLAAWDIRV